MLRGKLAESFSKHQELIINVLIILVKTPQYVLPPTGIQKEG